MIKKFGCKKFYMKLIAEVGTVRICKKVMKFVKITGFENTRQCFEEIKAIDHYAFEDDKSCKRESDMKYRNCDY